MRIVLGLNDTDIAALRSLREEQSIHYDGITNNAEKEERDLTEPETGELESTLEKLDVLAKIEGVIDNQIELDKAEGK